MKNTNLLILVSFIQRFILFFNFARNPRDPRENSRNTGFLSSRPINSRVFKWLFYNAICRRRNAMSFQFLDTSIEFVAQLHVYWKKLEV